jgi:SAM-dependent methyltransferase
MMLNLIRKIIPKRDVKYDENFFQDQWFKSWEDLKIVLASLIESHSDWKRILDFGCGPGIMVDFMTAKSFQYIGCDYSVDAAKLYRNRYGLYPEKYVDSLQNPACQQAFDVFLSFDVFEHLTDDQISLVLKAVPHIPQLFLNISRTRGIPGHINLKSDRQWIQFIETNGYAFDESATKKIRDLYASIRVGSPDRWDKNLFIFSKIPS